MTTPPVGEGAAAGGAPRFSWRRGFLHALLALVVFVVVGGVIFAFVARPGSDARKFGQAVGRLAGLAAAVAFCVSWLRQTGRRKMALGAGIAFAALIGAAAGGVMLAGRGPSGPASAALTDAERVPLVVVDEGGERRLRHPAFGFSVLHPGEDLKDAPELAKQMEGKRSDPGTQHYAFADPGGSVVMFSVMKGMGGTRDSLSEHVDGFQSGFVGTAAGSPDLRWLGKEITWNEARHDARLTASLGGDARLELVSYAVTRAGQPPFIVNMMVVSREMPRFEKMLSSFRP